MNNGGVKVLINKSCDIADMSMSKRQIAGDERRRIILNRALGGKTVIE